MSTSNATRWLGAVGLVSLVAVVGCAAEMPEEGASEQAVTADNRIAVNRIAVNRIAVNRIAVNRIAVNRIAVNGLGTEVFALDPDAVRAFFVDDNGAPNPDGQLVLEYLIGCAFPPSMVFQGPAFDGSSHTYGGTVGLAPRWVDRRLKASERRWLSACMLARANANDIPIEISLRGDDDALATTAAEESEFSVQEGAFFGDIFTGTAPIIAYACRGAQDGSSADLADRQCTQPGAAPGTTVCGLVDLGDCADVCRTDEGYFERCRPGARAKRVDEVVTVYLR